ncbi:MAG: hypothetical protein JRD19_06130 [Deltaproteobacteria bacterium]|nr:hypothetical protein [Deltaproteobacteria bacterium]
MINVSSKDRKIGLSIKAMDEDAGEDSAKDYKKKQAAGPATIGDLLKEELESKETSSKTEAKAAKEPVTPAAQEAEEVKAEAEPAEEETEPEDEAESPAEAETGEDKPETDEDKE